MLPYNRILLLSRILEISSKPPLIRTGEVLVTKVANYRA